MSDNQTVRATDDRILHRLWTKAVGTEGYDKAEWVELERIVHQKAYATPPEIESGGECSQSLRALMSFMVGQCYKCKGTGKHRSIYESGLWPCSKCADLREFLHLLDDTTKAVPV